MRKTVRQRVQVEGVTLHSGRRASLTLSPAQPNSGIVFRRSDIQVAAIPAHFERVSETRLGTALGQPVVVNVIEHLMAALAATGIDDAEVCLDGPEPPILDGSAADYLKLIGQAGISEHAAPREIIVVRRAVHIERGDASASLLPAPCLSFDLEIHFPSAAIGHQAFSWDFSSEGFAKDIAAARTFGFLHEWEDLNRAGLALGASLENTIAIDRDCVMNPEHMRFTDEFVRHKILDAVGDLALAGAPLQGRFVGRCSGHALNNQVLRALFADSANYERVVES